MNDIVLMLNKFNKNCNPGTSGIPNIVLNN